MEGTGFQVSLPGQRGWKKRDVIMSEESLSLLKNGREKETFAAASLHRAVRCSQLGHTGCVFVNDRKASNLPLWTASSPPYVRR